MRRIRGFTIIELLVVVMIIFFLLAAVLVALPKAKGRGNDAALKADLATIQVQGVQYYGIGNTYGVTNTGASASCALAGTVFNDTTTTADDTIGSAITSAQKNAVGNSVLCRSTSSAFLVAGQLASTHYWCVDSVGHAVDETSAPGNTVTACP